MVCKESTVTKREQAFKEADCSPGPCDCTKSAWRKTTMTAIAMPKPPMFFAALLIIAAVLFVSYSKWMTCNAQEGELESIRKSRRERFSKSTCQAWVLSHVVIGDFCRLGLSKKPFRSTGHTQEAHGQDFARHFHHGNWASPTLLQIATKLDLLGCCYMKRLASI